MGRNGTKKPVFRCLAEFINGHVGETVKLEEIMLGREPGANTVTLYVYQLTQLGYLEADGFVKDKSTRFRIVKPLPDLYGTTDLQRELKRARGMVV